MARELAGSSPPLGTGATRALGGKRSQRPGRPPNRREAGGGGNRDASPHPPEWIRQGSPWQGRGRIRLGTGMPVQTGPRPPPRTFARFEPTGLPHDLSPELAHRGCSDILFWNQSRGSNRRPAIPTKASAARTSSERSAGEVGKARRAYYGSDQSPSRSVTVGEWIELGARASAAPAGGPTTL